MISVIRDNPKEANSAYKSRDQLALIAPDKIISGGWVLHVLDPGFLEAHLSGNQEEAQAIIDKWTNREIIGGKIIAITATGIVVTAVTGGTGFLPYVAGISAATTVSIGLDDQIRNTLITGNYLSAADQATYHFPFLGSGRNMHNAYKSGNKGKFFFHLGMLGVEGFGLSHAAKSGARTVTSAEKALESVQKTGKGAGNAVANSATIGKSKIPEGFSKMAKGNKPSTPGKCGHYIEPKTVNQKLALEEAMCEGAGPASKVTECYTSVPERLTKNIEPLTDPRFKDLNVSKYMYVKEIRDARTGKIIEKIQINYIKDHTTGELFDFKFKDI